MMARQGTKSVNRGKQLKLSVIKVPLFQMEECMAAEVPAKNPPFFLEVFT